LHTWPVGHIQFRLSRLYILLFCVILCCGVMLLSKAVLTVKSSVRSIANIMYLNFNPAVESRDIQILLYNDFYFQLYWSKTHLLFCCCVSVLIVVGGVKCGRLFSDDPIHRAVWSCRRKKHRPCSGVFTAVRWCWCPH